MSRKIQVTIIVFSLALVLFTVVGGLGVRASTSDGAYRELGVYSEVLSRIRSEYVEEPNIGRVTEGALHGLLESLDSHSGYLTPAEYRRFRQEKDKAGSADIGAVFSKRFGYAAVITVMPGSPAEKAGLEAGDIVEALDQQSTREMALAEIVRQLSGAPGSQVKLTVVRARQAEPQNIVVTREIYRAPQPQTQMLEQGIGYIKVYALPEGKSEQVARAVRALERSGASKLILDLRGVAEGDPKDGVDVADLFLDRGTITYLQGQRYPRESFNAKAENTVTRLPLVVLVDRTTAGAAEIVAAAVLENARGDVVGDKTFGEGSIQKLIEIPDGSALILSVAKYYTPGGKAIQDEAVTPNIQVASDRGLSLAEDEDGGVEELPEAAPPKQDEQLRRAIEVLEGSQPKVAKQGAGS